MAGSALKILAPLAVRMGLLVDSEATLVLKDRDIEQGTIPMMALGDFKAGAEDLDGRRDEEVRLDDGGDQKPIRLSGSPPGSGSG